MGHSSTFVIPRVLWSEFGHGASCKLPGVGRLAVVPSVNLPDAWLLFVNGNSCGSIAARSIEDALVAAPDAAAAWHRGVAERIEAAFGAEGGSQ